MMARWIVYQSALSTTFHPERMKDNSLMGWIFMVFWEMLMKNDSFLSHVSHLTEEMKKCLENTAKTGGFLKFCNESDGVGDFVAFVVFLFMLCLSNNHSSSCSLLSYRYCNDVFYCYCIPDANLPLHIHYYISLHCMCSYIGRGDRRA